MKVNKQKRGISLIVLVITIIVMIILATAIILALDGSGVIGKANEAKNKTNKAALLETANLLAAEWELESKLGNDTEGAVMYITNGLKGNGFTDEQIAKLKISETGVIELKPETALASEKLKQGDYVIYTDNDGNEIPCIVLYDKSIESNIEIVSTGVVDQIELDGADFSWTGQNNDTFRTSIDYSAVLSDATKEYLNTKLASSVRCIGDRFVNENEWHYIYSNFEWLNDAWIDKISDLDKLKELNMLYLDESYWLGVAEACYHLDGNVTDYVFFVEKNGLAASKIYNYTNNNLSMECNVEGGDYCLPDITYQSLTKGLRPVFKLLDTVKVVSGDGKSIDTAYKLVI